MVYQKTKSTLHREGLAPKKALGQNFLVHQHTATYIADLANIQPEETVIEVGVGLGALTTPLAKQAAKVVGIEADSGIVRMHREQKDLPDNVDLRHADILKTDLGKLAQEAGQRLKIVANLPYSISSPFLFHLIAHRQHVQEAVVMLQKEVAQRLAAQPGNKQYGAPTVLLASCADVSTLLLVKPEEFHPRPKIDSLVIRITFHPVPAHVRNLPEFDHKLFKKIVNAAFNQRRKTLLNSLSSVFNTLDKSVVKERIESAGIEASVRAEKLSLEDFVHLARGFAKQ
ncbi:16S rRNA (adenine(1518)-N(6)/adenine(1519)-N(6))-dimethyltransferase RsmA [Desulfogranum japonicum]|uniref:16S rRNA (adenine(1518)-N(6)/adenine(1519)-N(6))- dimethyltransferase RsmA n=1 Tax=Desulfogranum japonicum TaxID=231447 RepID=UPI000419908A|nr:16S rRNA (adenine(1518)-N(6)/adenine(1519)-N(6))-dimethyltransferase RsmA [Desulfogranum japonicum]